DENSTTPADAPNPPSPDADPDSPPPAGAAPTDQQALLAASAAAANQASSGQSPPVTAAQTSTSNAGDTPQDLHTGIGAAPAQLVNNLLQADIAIGNTPESSTVGATQAAAGQPGKNPGEANAP